MTDSGTWFLVGCVVGFHGLKGQMKVQPQTNNLQLLLDIKSVEIRRPGYAASSAQVKDVKLHKNLLLLSLEGFPDRSAAESLLKAQLFTPKNQLRKLADDEWWIEDLIGLTAFTTTGNLIGQITAVYGGGNQLLEISTPQQKEPILVPFVRSLVPLVDISKSRVEIVDLPGLLE